MARRLPSVHCKQWHKRKPSVISAFLCICICMCVCICICIWRNNEWREDLPWWVVQAVTPKMAECHSSLFVFLIRTCWTHLLSLSLHKTNTTGWQIQYKHILFTNTTTDLYSSSCLYPPSRPAKNMSFPGDIQLWLSFQQFPFFSSFAFLAIFLFGQFLPF